jgi:basic membrane protein A
LVTDLAGVDDRSFNAAAWQGVQDAAASGGAAADPILLESDEQADYAPNLDQCLAQGAQHIVTVGFELGDATATYAAANPDVTFTIVDFAYDPEIPNVRGLIYQTDEAAFAAGYLAAGVSQSGVVGTYGGLNIPPVSIFMDGFAKGVAHYNEVNGANVTVLGWDVAAQDGTFTGTFDPADPLVRSTCESMLDEGADIMLPVGGAINLPCGTAIQDRGIEAALVGVDVDAFDAAPAEYQDLWLVSILKGIAIQVQRSIEDHANGAWTPGVTVGALANDGVGLSEFHSWSDRVPADLAAEVEQILADIASGALSISE